MRAIGRFPIKSRIGSTSAGWPYICTSMIAPVFGPMAPSIVAADIFQVPSSTSTKTGTKPESTTAIAQETIVNDGRMTSLPRGRLRALTATWSAAVPLQTPIACGTSQYSANLASKRSR